MTDQTSESSSKQEAKQEKKAPKEAATAMVDDLMTQIKTLEAERDETKDKMLRLAAELQNKERMHEQRLKDAHDYAVTAMAKDMLAVSENLHRALETIGDENKDENAPLKSLFDGVEMTQRELLNVFEKHGITRVMPEPGSPFDHDAHQAISQMPTAEYPAGTIAQVLQGGYQIHKRLLRPALVVVAKQPE